MATPGYKQFLEEHVEKIVLAVCVLLLAFVGVHWLAGSPRQVELDVGGAPSGPVPPHELDAAVQQAARSLQEWANRQEPEVEPVPDLVARFEQIRPEPFPTQLAQLPVIAPADEVIVVPEPEVPDKIRLATLQEEIPVPSQPRVKADYELRHTESPEDIVAAHVVSVYPLEDLRGSLREALQYARQSHGGPVIAQVNVQVQQRQPNGSWSAPQDVDTVRRQAQDRDRTLAEMPQITPFDGQNFDEVHDSVTERADWQRMIVQPEYWDIFIPEGAGWGDWRVNLPENPVSRELAEQLKAQGESLEVEVRRAFERARESDAGDSRRDTERRGGSSRYDEGEVYGDGGYEYGEGEYGEGERTYGGRRGTRRPRRRPSRDEQTRTVRRETEPEPLPEVQPTPEYETQIDNGELLIWAHDTSLKPGQTYRYRLRVELVNPLLGIPEELEDSSDASVETIASNWSDWSEQISVGYPTQFFLTGQDPRSEQVIVTIFTKELGQTVEQPFAVRQGQSIGDTHTVRVVNPVTGVSEDRKCDFTTGAVTVQLDFDKPVQSAGISGMSTGTTSEMFYVDDQQELRTRLRARDINSER
ncbi:MAG: hypothetical protein ACOC93_03120, partial [Planctomycetota bacterium]